MKTINLFFDFEFTSLSPDAQPISVGIVSCESEAKCPIGVVGWNRESAFNVAIQNNLNPYDKKECVILFKPEHFCSWEFSDIIIPKEAKTVEGYELSKEMQDAVDFALKQQVHTSNGVSKSFYAEFSDFEINRCDDWVKENVLSKLTISSFKNVMPNGAENNEYEVMDFADNSISYYGDTHKIKESLKEWLSQFYDYQIQFVSDCGTFDWYWMLQLLAEWEQKENVFEYDETVKPSEIEIPKRFDMFHGRYVKTGLPKLPENISPVPEDLNDRIAFKKGISVKEAFDLNREVLAFGIHSNSAFKKMLDEEQFSPYKEKINKHNSLWDAKVIKNVYNKLK